MSEISERELEAWQERERDWHKRVVSLEKLCDDLQRLTIQMGELNKKYDTQLQDHDARLKAIEQRPARHWSALVSSVISAVGGAVGGAVLTMIAQNLK